MPEIKTVKASLTKDRIASLKKEDNEKYGRLPNEGVEASVQYDFGATPAEAASYFGDKVVMRLLNFAISHPIQSKIRDMLAEGKSPAQIQAAIYDVANKKHIYKPGEGAVRKSAVEKEAERLAKLDPEARKREKEALLKILDSM